jgi:hypothetical protein
VIPFDVNPISAAGEQIIFGAEFTYPITNYHKLVYTSTGGTFDTTTGPSNKTYNGLHQRNIYFFINTPWNGTTPVNVTLEVQIRSDNSVVHSTTWNFSKKTTVPTTITQQEGAGERPLPSTYSYKLGPDLGGDGVDDYIGQTILETFGQRTCNITMAELKDSFKAAHPEITGPASITAYFFGTSSGNGTFTASAGDMIYDQHSGGMPSLATFQNALKTMKEVYVDLPQVYEAQPGVTLGRYTVRRIMKTNGDKKLKKMVVT